MNFDYNHPYYRPREAPPWLKRMRYTAATQQQKEHRRGSVALWLTAIWFIALVGTILSALPFGAWR